MSNRYWQGDWQARIRRYARERGFEGIVDFLRNRPGVPFTKLCKELGNDVAPVQISLMARDEAIDEHRSRWLAADCLARYLRERLSKGWADDDKGRYDRAGAYADWICFVSQEGMLRTYQELADQVWNRLEQLNPPSGWLPASGDDELIVQSFARGWPPL